VQERPKGMVKTDKRDALGLANRLYTQLELGAQVEDCFSGGMSSRINAPIIATN